MENQTFDPGKIMLLAYIFFMCFLSVQSDYTCNYLTPIAHGWYSIEEMECEFGCCGDLSEQRCCTKSEVDQTHWIIAVSVIGGLLVLSVLIVVIVCVIHKKNLDRVKVYTGDNAAAAGPARNTPGGFIELNRMTPSAPPPYSRGGYQLFTVQNGVQQNPNNDKNSSVAYNNNTGQSVSRDNIPPPPAYMYG